MMRVRRDGMRLTTATGNTPEIVTQIQKVKRGAVEKRGGGRARRKSPIPGQIIPVRLFSEIERISRLTKLVKKGLPVK